MATRSSLTVVSGTTITSAWGNLVRDHTVPKTGSDDVSSTGQMAFNTATGRLVYHNGTIAVPIAAVMPRAKASTSTPTPISTGTLTTPNWTTQVYDTDSMFTAFDSKIYAPFAGTYLVSWKLSFASAANGSREAFVGVGGAATRQAGASVPVGSTASSVVLSSAAEVDLTVGAYVQLFMYQSSGGTINVQNDVTDYFSLRYLGPT